MKSKMYMFLMLVLLLNLVSAVDWTPQGDINLRDRYYITNDPAGNCQSGYMVVGKLNNGSWNCSLLSDTHVAGDGVYLYNDSDTMYFNESRMNNTIDNRDTNCSVDGSCPDIIYESEESTLNVNGSLYSNQTTWWSGVTSYISNWFIKTGNSLDFNETKLNETIDLREKDKGTNGFYLYNDTTLIYFNETQLNNTIDNREIVSNETHLIVWTNDTNNVFIKSGYPSDVNVTGVIYAINGSFSSLKVIGQNVCLENGTNCPPDFNDTHVKGDDIYLYNDSDTMYLNETKLNDTIKINEGNLNVNSSVFSNWWAGVDNWVSGWFYNNSGSLDFNETKLNETIDSRENDTHVKGDDIYLYNDSDTMYLNETKLNNTIYDIEKNTSGFYVYNDSETIYFNETQLNNTIDSRENDTLYFAGDIYIYKNLSNYFILNETKLNETIDAREIVSNETDLIVFANDTNSIFIKEGYPNNLNFSNVLFVNGTTGLVSIDGNETNYSMVQLKTGDTINTVWRTTLSPDGNMTIGYGFNHSGFVGNITDVFVFEPTLSTVRQTSWNDKTHFIVEADVSDLNDHNSPKIYLKQDGGNTIAYWGLEGTENHTLDYGLADAVLFGHVGNKAIQFFTNNVIRMTILGDKVGIGTNNPQAELHVVGAMIGNLSWSNLTDYPVGCPEGYAVSNISDEIVCIDLGGYWNVSGNDIFYDIGNVGIGRVPVSHKLDVLGNLRLTDYATSKVAWDNSQIIIEDPDDETNKLTIGFDTTANAGVFTVGKEGVGWYNLLFNPRGGNVGIGLGINGTPTAYLDLPPSTVSTPSVRIRFGTPPTTPIYGDIWHDELGLNFVNHHNTIKHLSPEKIIYVHSLADFPTVQGDGYIYLENRVYYIVEEIVLNGSLGYNGFYIENDAEIIGSGTIFYVGQNPTTSNALFKSDDMDNGFLLLKSLQVLSDGSGRLFNLTGDPSGILLLETFVAGGFYSLGYVENVSYFGLIVNYVQNVVGGLTLKDNSAVAIQSHRFYDWFNAGATFITIEGTQQNIQVSNNFFQPQSNENTLYFNPTMNTTGGSVIGNAFDLTQSGNIFQSGSKEQNDVFWTYSGNQNLEDSTVLGDMFFLDNTETTTITSQSEPVVARGLFDDVVERFKLQNLITYGTQTSNYTVGATITGITSGATGLIVADNDTGVSGVLTLENVVGKFIVTELINGSLGGSANYIGASGRFLYIGLEDTSLKTSVSTALLPSSGINIKLSTYISKNGIVINSSEGSQRISSGAGNEESIYSQSIVQLETNDYLELFVENEDTTADILVTDSSFIVTKV